MVVNYYKLNSEGAADFEKEKGVSVKKQRLSLFSGSFMQLFVSYFDEEV